MPTLTITPGSAAPYRVVVEPGALASLGAALPAAARRVVVVSDSRVARLRGEAVVERLRSEGRAVDLLVFPEGEASKTRETKAGLEDEMATRGVGRDAVVVGLGGGVTTDLAGFLAATWMRGLPFVAVPTSLLAMVDAAVGGKTGVDLPAGKNLVGAFHQPVAVVADPTLLATLAPLEIACGLAEMAKHALIADPAALGRLAVVARAGASADPGAWCPLVARSVEVKAAVVARDERESGERAVLNLGHTVGHGIERASRWAVRHGLAVAVGLVAEARIARDLGLLPAADASEVESALAALGLPVRLPPGLAPADVLAAAATDKKGRAGRTRYALLSGVGRPARGPDGWTFEVPDEVALSALSELVR